MGRRRFPEAQASPVSLEFSLEISLAGRAGITGQVGPELTGSLNGSCINVGADLAVELDANVDIFVHSWEITLWSGHFFPVQLAHFCFTSTPPPAGETPTGKGGGSGGGPPTPGSTPAGSPGSRSGSIDIGWSASHRGWITMTLSGYTSGTYAYGCDFGSGGDQSFSVRVTANPETFDNGQTCYDTIPGDTVWATIGSVRSNVITVSGSPTPPPTPTPTSPPRPASIQIGWSGSHPSWIWMTLTGFSPGEYTYSCDFGSGGDENFNVGVSSDPQTFDNGQTCYDAIPGDTVWVTINSVRSNTITVSGSPTPPPTPTPTATPASIQIGWSGSHPSWIWMTVNGFAPAEYTYSCDFGSGGDQSFRVGVTSDPETFDNGETCYDGIRGDTVWVTINSVRSNTIAVP